MIPVANLPLLSAGLTHSAPSLLWAIPFALILLQIALWPLIAPRWWAKNYPWVTLPLGVIVAVYYVFFRHATTHMLHTGHEYLSFIALIGSLFVVSGGIHVGLPGGKFSPKQNIVLLAIGAVIANIFGTTGASMILIRPFIRGNQWRFSKYHIVFFIFIVSNCGGALTPIGDPPLFLGYLRGVPFFWVLTALWYKWLVGIAILLATFFIIDQRSFRKQNEADKQVALQPNAIVFDGLQNLFFIFMILAAAFVTEPILLREGLMIAAAVGSYLTTKKEIHTQNNFNFHPIQEVAILFAAIFAAMVPALDWLSANAASLGITTASQFYWITGGLSAVLDNAPTYLNFLSAGMGLFDLNVGDKADVMRFALEHADMLRTISISAVFFGAMTYIGNGPNFMCKAIAEHEKVATPSFIEYTGKYAIPLLAPVLIVTYFLVR